MDDLKPRFDAFRRGQEFEARADAFAQLIEEVEGGGCGG